MTSRLLLRHLVYTGPGKLPAKLRFVPGLNLLLGASNTGKSFAVKTVDFLLGAGSDLPVIEERSGYDQAWLGFSNFPPAERTLVRALSGGSIQLINGLLEGGEVPSGARRLSPQNDAERADNISQFLLELLGLKNKQVVKDSNGVKKPLSFRDIARYCIVDETAMWSEVSPIHSGQHSKKTVERSTFKLLITGVDDSAVAQTPDRKTLRTSTAAKLEVFNGMIAAVDAELASKYPDAAELFEQHSKLTAPFDALQAELQAAQGSVRTLLVHKRKLAQELSLQEERLADVHANLARFEQLNNIYHSDIQRLESLEEAGFILSLDGEKDCPLCGAATSAQRHEHPLQEIDLVRAAALAEADKVRKQQVDLGKTMEALKEEQDALSEALPLARNQLAQLEEEVSRLTPQVSARQNHFTDLLKVRDRVRHGLALLEQKRSLTQKRDEVASTKPERRAGKMGATAEGAAAHDFAQIVSDVLRTWRFPGKHHVAFDEKEHDLLIDGKRRRDNGKGVRAITHAAFKVALLVFCEQRNLPHPGFLILDTPLLTYRDPLRSRAGELSTDELALARSPLREHFLDHLSGLGEIGQFIIVENIDPPANAKAPVQVEVFSGNARRGRAGLFPPP